MKNILSIVFTVWLLSACNNNSTTPSAASTDQVFTSKQKNGKWTTDLATSQELKGMHYTIENFTLLNKKKFENLKAYQEFGDLMQMHIERITTYCKLDIDTKNLLCKELDKIKGEVQTLHGNDMEKSKEALKNINTILAEMDSSFQYMN